MIRDRPTAEHIMKVLEAKKGIGMRFSDVNRAMIAEGHIHTCSAISDNFRVLIKQGKIIKVGRYYGIPDENGKLEPWEAKLDAKP
jgi:hypothetical protein